MSKQLDLFGQLDDSKDEREEIVPIWLDQLIDLDSGEDEREEMPAYLALLKRAIPADDDVLQDYVETVGPRMLKEYTLQPAKGGFSKPEYSHNTDQSMLTHILNGIFPTLQIVRESGEDLSELEKQLYLTAYTFHDLDKLESIQNLSVADAEKARQFYHYLDDWVKRLHFDEFFPDYDEYRGDIAFLILNTHTKFGANLNLQSYDLYLPGHRRQFLREMCTCSDLIAYFLQNPASFLDRGKIQDSLTYLSGGRLEFAYHKVSENRGMLTNVINNALLAEMQDKFGWKPLLFFPTGVTYLRPRNGQEMTLPTGNDIAEVVVEKLKTYCASRLRQNLNGFSRGPHGLKYADFYNIFFHPSEMLHVIQKGCFKILRQEKVPKAGQRLAKIEQLQRVGKIPEDIPLNFEDDIRVDQLAEYLTEVERFIGRFVDRQTIAEAIIAYLKMGNWQTAFASIPWQGSMPLPWYFIAGKYLLQNPGKDERDMRDLFMTIATHVTEVFAESICNHPQSDSFAVLRDYVKQTVDINGQQNIRQDFQIELTRYINTKKTERGSEKGCSLCSSAFKGRESEETDVIFQAQVYSNKNPINSTRLTRGICQLCQLEMMLRQILIRSNLNLIGKGYEERKIKWVYLYPSYFFTPETAKVIGEAYQNLKSLNFFDVRRALHQGTTITDLIERDEFKIPSTEKENLLKIDFGKNDLATFYFCGIPTLGSKPTDTESWAMPTFLALLSTLAFNAKAVVTESQVPLYHSAEEFKETVVFNAPHSFVTHILKKDRLRIDEVAPSLEKLASVYDINIDVFRDGPKPQWQHLNGVARNIDTDPLYVFHYLDIFRRRNKSDSSPSYEDGDILICKRYLQFYETLGGDKMSLIEEVAKRCFKFYGPDNFNPNSVLKVITLVEDVIVNSEPKICPTDLKYQAIGEVSNLMQRIRASRAQGYARLRYDEETLAIHEFVEYFYHTVFAEYYDGERGMLRQRRNRFNAGINAWYKINWHQFQTKQAKEDNNANN